MHMISCIFRCSHVAAAIGDADHFERRRIGQSCTSIASTIRSPTCALRITGLGCVGKHLGLSSLQNARSPCVLRHQRRYFPLKKKNARRNTSQPRRATTYHPAENDYRYRSEIKSKTIGLYQITDVTDLY